MGINNIFVHSPIGNPIPALGNEDGSIVLSQGLYKIIIDVVDSVTTYIGEATLGNKVDKETGKGLSTNDYTTAEQSKLSGISGSNTGDETAARIAAIITGSGAQTTPLDADEFTFYKIVGTVLSKVTWSNIKATLKAYFDGVYAAAATDLVYYDFMQFYCTRVLVR